MGRVPEHYGRALRCNAARQFQSSLTPCGDVTICNVYSLRIARACIEDRTRARQINRTRRSSDSTSPFRGKPLLTAYYIVYGSWF